MHRGSSPIGIRRRLLVGLVALVAAAATAGTVPSAGRSAPASPGSGPSRLVSPREFSRVVSQFGVVTINVLGPRTPYIAGTDLMIAADRLVASRAKLPAISTTLAVYCWSGHTSARAVQILRKLGYRHIVELRGGMLAWQAAGLPLRAPTG